MVQLGYGLPVQHTANNNDFDSFIHDVAPAQKAFAYKYTILQYLYRSELKCKKMANTAQWLHNNS